MVLIVESVLRTLCAFHAAQQPQDVNLSQGSSQGGLVRGTLIGLTFPTSLKLDISNQLQNGNTIVTAAYNGLSDATPSSFPAPLEACGAFAFLGSEDWNETRQSQTVASVALPLFFVIVVGNTFTAPGVFLLIFIIFDAFF